MNVFIDVRDRLKMLVKRNKKLKYFPRLEKPIDETKDQSPKENRVVQKVKKCLLRKRIVKEI